MIQSVVCRFASFRTASWGLRGGLAAMCLFLSVSVAGAGETEVLPQTPQYVAGDPPYLERDAVQAFIDEQVETGWEREELEALFRAVDPQQRILDLISRPAEARPWYSYRPIFVTDQRIEEGRAFMEEQAEWLQKAEAEYGVDAAMITAIIGVETNYGRNLGSFRVLDALVTLGFDYDPRAAFFRSELGHFLQLVSEESLDVRETSGSYAGAMGRGQFISSSYRAYAVDFDGDGRRDLINSWADAIGSVANYFAEHRWESGRPIVVEAKVEGERHEALLRSTYEALHTLEILREHGVEPQGEVDPDGRYSLIRLEEVDGDRYLLGYPNFYVITRYNRSPLYAMVVSEIADALGL